MSGQNGSYWDDVGLCLLQRHQIVSDGCKIMFSKWGIRRRSLHQTTIRISTFRKQGLCMQTQKGFIWAKESS